MTTTPLCSNVYFLLDDPYHLTQEGLDGPMDNNRQTIAVTLCLRLAARVNNNGYIMDMNRMAVIPIIL